MKSFAPSVSVDLVIGTRPNIVKAAPLLAELKAAPWCLPRVVFLAQHTLDAMSDQTLDDLLIAPEDIHRIDLSGGRTGSRLGEMIERYMLLLQAEPPRLVMVFGDVDATLAAAYATKRSFIPLAHVEAGLRSGDMRMPEELNRRMVDSIADLLFTTTEGAGRQLEFEGQDAARIHFSGNLMIDAMRQVLSRESVRKEGIALCRDLGIEPDSFAIATFHRPSNVDGARALEEVKQVLEATTRHITTLFSVHPRTRAALQQHGMEDELAAIANLRLVPPLRYRHFMALLSLSRMALTDSGGLQEETSVLGIPCLTFRENTERPETITQGTNRLVRVVDAEREVLRILGAPMPVGAIIPGWDGQAAARIAHAVRAWKDSAYASASNSFHPS